MTEIILARHGETEWNAKERIRGLADIALNANGIKQAKLLAQYLGSRKIEAVYSSPLQRAWKTARMIARYHQLEVVTAPALIDINYGEWQGLSPEEIRERQPELYATWLAHPQRLRIPGGERLGQVRKRTMVLVQEVVATHAGTIVLVSHRAVNQVLICALLGLDNSHFWNIKQDLCGTTTFTYAHGRFVLTEHNNTAYLKLV